MKCVSVLSTQKNRDVAVSEVLDRARGAMGLEPADLAPGLRLAGSGRGPLAGLRRASDGRLARHVIGCTAETVVAEGRKSKTRRRWAACRVSPHPHRLTFEEGQIGGWVPPNLGAEPPQGMPTLLVLGDPFSFAADPFLSGSTTTTPPVCSSSAGWPAGARPRG